MSPISGFTGAAEVHVEILGANPVVNITSPSGGATFIEGEPISFAATATDEPDGDLSAGISWISSRDGPLFTGASSSEDTLSVGTHQITAEVSDGAGLSGSDTITVTVEDAPLGNTAPVVSITSPTSGESFTAGDPIAFAGTATDAEEGNLSSGLVWTSDLDGELFTGASSSEDTLSVGTHEIEASVTDTAGTGLTGVGDDHGSGSASRWWRGAAGNGGAGDAPADHGRLDDWQWLGGTSVERSVGEWQRLVRIG